MSINIVRHHTLHSMKISSNARHSHKNTIQAVSWSPSGDHVAAASRDQTVRVFDIRAMKEFRLLKGHKKEVCCTFPSLLDSHLLTTHDSTCMASYPPHPSQRRKRRLNPALGHHIPLLRRPSHKHHHISAPGATRNPKRSTRLERLVARIPPPRAPSRFRLKRPHDTILEPRETGRRG
jgi:hypothetical protein